MRCHIANNSAIIYYHSFNNPPAGEQMNKEDMEKVQMYFDAALSLPAEQRSVFLSELCGKDSEIYSKAMSLLNANEQSKIWNADTPELSPAPSSTQQYKVFQAGDSIGTYNIVEQIGVGGMGIIFKAFDTKLQRNVALKFLPVNLLSDENTRQRFLSEARSASQLDHPNICVIHDVSETPDGQMYITMPCYDGETLAKRISRGPLLQKQAVEIALQIAQGLAVAHKNNIVHRDIKPANIMLTEETGVKILDFGIAKVQDNNLTNTGMSVGTLAYMSPEQLRGKKVAASTDIWALGVVLFEMLSGKQAFPAKALPDILQAVLNQSEDELKDLKPILLPAIYDVLRNALKRDLKQRYNDISEMIAALNNALESFSKKHNKPATAKPLNLSSAQTVVTPQHGSTAFLQTPAADRSTVKKPSAYEWDEQVLEKISSLLVNSLGPIAPVMVKRKAKKASDLNELTDMLIQALPDQQSKDDFSQQIDSQVAALTSQPLPRALKTDGSLAGVELSTLQISQIESALIKFLGPITPALIKRHMQNVVSVSDLLNQLSHHLVTEKDKKVFLDKMHKLFS